MLYPPGPPLHHPLNLVGRARTIQGLITDPIAFVYQRFQTWGDLYCVEERPSGHLYVSRHPDHMREVLVEQASRFRKTGGAMDRLVPFVGQGLLTSDGDLWRQQRRSMQPAFHQKRIASYADTMASRASRVSWEEEEVIDIGAEMQALTLSIAAKTLFDHDVDGEMDGIARVMQAFHEGTAPQLLPSLLPTPRNLASTRAISAMDGLVERLVAERRAEGGRDDLLSMLLEIDGISDQQVRDEIITLFIAGHDTTSHALTWTWMLLSRHPDAETRLHDELDTHLRGRPPSLRDLPALPWTQAVVKEAMRLYPPAYAVARVATEPATLGGYDLEPGAQVVLWIFHAHRDGRWFHDPLRFMPERFLGEPDFPKHAYLPFGAGTRMCIGRDFAMLEMQLVLATLAQRYHLELQPQHIRMRPRVTLGPAGPMWMRVEER